jgi:hypothetical protein
MNAEALNQQLADFSLSDRNHGGPVVRILKVEESGDFAAGQVNPYIRLRGKWLAKFGFKPNTRVEVQCSDGQLILVPQLPPPEFAKPLRALDAAIANHDEARKQDLRESSRGLNSTNSLEHSRSAVTGLTKSSTFSTPNPVKEVA